MKQFIALYDKAPIFSLKGKDIFEQYQALGIEDKMSHTTSKVEEVLIGKILNPISQGDRRLTIHRRSYPITI